jgi:hypothetical protein
MSQRSVPVTLTTHQVGTIAAALDHWFEDIYEDEQELLKLFKGLYATLLDLEPQGSEVWRREAHLALGDLREALSMIPLPSSLYKPGTEPNAAEACGTVLELMEQLMKQLDRFVGPT